MEDYLVGKCYHTCDQYTNALIRIEDPLIHVEDLLNFDGSYICKRLIKSTAATGYSSDIDTLQLNSNILIEFDPIIWEKIYKILKMNAISCNTIVQNCKRYESPTGYYVSTFPIKLHYKLFEVLENSQILTRFSNDQARILELKTNSAIKFEKMISTSDEWISSETYHRVKDNVINTIKEIDDIWPIV